MPFCLWFIDLFQLTSLTRVLRNPFFSKSLFKSRPWCSHYVYLPTDPEDVTPVPSKYLHSALYVSGNYLSLPRDNCMRKPQRHPTVQNPLKDCYVGSPQGKEAMWKLLVEKGVQKFSCLSSPGGCLPARIKHGAPSPYGARWVWERWKNFRRAQGLSARKPLEGGSGEVGRGKVPMSCSGF